MIIITKELRQAIRRSRGKPVRLADPDTNDQYVLVRAEVYDRFKDLVYDDSPLTNDEKQHLLLKVGLRAGWDDPEMDVYSSSLDVE